MAVKFSCGVLYRILFLYDYNTICSLNLVDSIYQNPRSRHRYVVQSFSLLFGVSWHRYEDLGRSWEDDWTLGDIPILGENFCIDPRDKFHAFFRSSLRHEASFLSNINVWQTCAQTGSFWELCKLCSHWSLERQIWNALLKQAFNFKSIVRSTVYVYMDNIECKKVDYHPASSCPI